MNFAHMRLQYEILNKPISQLAAENDIPVDMLQEDILKAGWTQWWPDPDLVLIPDIERDEMLQAQSEAFLERAKRRLAVYNLAKEIILAQKYYELETGIIDAAITAIENTTNAEMHSISALSTLYKNMTARSITAALSTISFGEDEGGLPTVIIKDLSGTKR